MPVLELTKRQREIVNASLEILSTRGIQHLTIKTLSAHINVTEGAIYRHFSSKGEIFVAIAQHFKRSSTEILNQILSIPGNTLEKIRSFFLGRCQQFSTDRGLVMVIFSEDIFKGNPLLQKEIMGTIHCHKELLVETILEGQRMGIIRQVDPEHMFMVIMGALRLLVLRWRNSNFSFSLEEEGEKLWKSIEEMIRIF